MSEDLKILFRLYLFLQVAIIGVAVLYGSDIMIVSPYLSEMTAEKMDLYTSPDFSLKMANTYVYYIVSGINALTLLLMAAGLYNLIGRKNKERNFQLEYGLPLLQPI